MTEMLEKVNEKTLNENLNSMSQEIEIELNEFNSTKVNQF